VAPLRSSLAFKGFRVPYGSAWLSSVDSASVPSACHKGVTILRDEFVQAKVDLNAEVVSGYRLVAFLPKGTKSADATMERPATPRHVYQYRVLHVRYLLHLQKDLNKAALDG